MEELRIDCHVDRALIEDLRTEAREHRTVFVGRFDARSRVRAGDEIDFAVAVDNLHFFDLDTELAVGTDA